jgi:hypothetical protein
MNYRLVHQLQQKAIPVQQGCRALAVSRSGYYAAQQRTKRPKGVCAATVHLQNVFEASGHSYGSRRLSRELNDRVSAWVAIERGVSCVFISLNPSGNVSLSTPPTADTLCRCLTTCWIGNLLRPPPIRLGWRTSPISAPVAVGCTWLRCWTCIRVRSSAGRGGHHAGRAGLFSPANGDLPAGLRQSSRSYLRCDRLYR